MAVPEQTPYIEHTGNGVTTSFSLGFQCESKDHLIVLMDEIEPPIETWSLIDENVVFTAAPTSGQKITLQRNTPFSRTTDYQSYNNSFRPPAVNNDFDRAWWKIQELGVRDWLLGLKIQKFRDDVNLTAMEETLEQAQSLRDDTAAFAVDVQNNVTQSQTLLANTTAQANAAAISATNANLSKDLAKQYADNIDASLTAIAGGHKAYGSLAAALANTSTFPQDSIIEITNDPDPSKNGTYQWNGGDLTKSAYDPLTQAKADATTKANTAQANAINYTSQKIQSTIRSAQSNLKDQAAFAFTDNRGVRTWLEATEEGSPTEYARTSMLKSSGALIGITSNYSTGNAVTFVDSEDRILGILNGDEPASKEIISTGVDLSTWAFFGSSSMMYLQDDVFALLQSNFEQVRTPKYYGTSASRMQHTLANIGVNNASLSFVGGVIDNTARAVTPTGFEFGVPTIHTVKGKLENGISGTYKDAAFTADSGSLTVSATTPIKFISDGSTHRNAVALVNIGKNNVAATGADVDVLAGTRAAVEYLDERNDRHTIVLGHFVNTDQTEIGKANIISLNNSLRSIYYDRFIDIQAYLMGDQVWSDVGLTKTQADIDAIASGVLPPSLGRNNAHLSASVDIQLAEQVLNLVISKGWYA